MDAVRNLVVSAGVGAAMLATCAAVAVSSPAPDRSAVASPLATDLSDCGGAMYCVVGGSNPWLPYGTNPMVPWGANPQMPAGPGYFSPGFDRAF
jgi:hypothetical protein